MKFVLLSDHLSPFFLMAGALTICKCQNDVQFRFLHDNTVAS